MKNTKTLVLGAVLTALVFLLQYLGAFIKLGPFAISPVLIPIVIGAATCGVGVATWLGLVFGAAVLLCGDAAAFLAVSPIGTLITVFLKGILCGLCAALVYKGVLSLSKNSLVSVLCAALICPVVNTGVFLLGCLAFFMEPIGQWTQAAGFGADTAGYMIYVLVGGNFLVEVLTSLILSPIVVRLLKIRNKA